MVDGIPLGALTQSTPPVAPSGWRQGRQLCPAIGVITFKERQGFPTSTMRSGLAPKMCSCWLVARNFNDSRVLGLFTSIIILIFQKFGRPCSFATQLLLGHDESHPLHRAVHQSLQPRIPPVPRGEDSPFPSLPSCLDELGLFRFYQHGLPEFPKRQKVRFGRIL